MKCKLELTSWYGGENSNVDGTIEFGGENLKISLAGSASSRGSCVDITKEDGSTESEWWCGSEHPHAVNPILEEKIEEIFAEAYDAVDKHKEVDVDLNWSCEYDGEVGNIKQDEEEEC